MIARLCVSVSICTNPLPLGEGLDWTGVAACTTGIDLDSVTCGAAGSVVLNSVTSWVDEAWLTTGLSATSVFAC